MPMYRLSYYKLAAKSLLFILNYVGSPSMRIQNWILVYHY